MAARLGRGASLIVVTMACGVFTAASALAQSIPLPTPDPRAKTGATPAPPAIVHAPAPSAAAAAPAAAPRGFFPFSFSLDKGASAKATAFDAKQRALLEKISGYLSGVQTLVGSFVQVGPDGRRVEGSFYIQKPGKVRFAYNPPSPIEIIADGSAVVVRDRSLDTQDFYPCRRRRFATCSPTISIFCATPTSSAYRPTIPSSQLSSRRPSWWLAPTG
jgi:hypothetical protein